MVVAMRVMIVMTMYVVIVIVMLRMIGFCLRSIRVVFVVMLFGGGTMRVTVIFMAENHNGNAIDDQPEKGHEEGLVEGDRYRRD